MVYPTLSPVSTGGLSEPQCSAPSPVFSGDVRGVAVPGTGAMKLWHIPSRSKSDSRGE